MHVKRDLQEGPTKETYQIDQKQRSIYMTRQLLRGLVKETWIRQKRCAHIKRDLLDRATTEICMHGKTITERTYKRDHLIFQIRKRDICTSKETCIHQKRPTKETWKKDLQKRHIKETYKKD